MEKWNELGYRQICLMQLQFTLGQALVEICIG